MLSFNAFDHRNERNQHNDTKQTNERTPNNLLPYKTHTLVCISPNDVPGYDKERYMPDIMKDENGKTGCIKS